MADWSSLPPDIWTLTMENLTVEDCLSFASVSTWCLAIVRTLKRCQHSTPWLIISAEAPFFSFYDIANDRVNRISLPELKDTTILGTSEGWLVIGDKKTANIRLFNPFSRLEITLPATVSFPTIVNTDRDLKGMVTYYHVESRVKVVKNSPLYVCTFYFGSAYLTSSNGEYIVVVKYKGGHGLAMARSGDKKWSGIEIPGQLERGVFYEGLFYAMMLDGSVSRFDFRSTNKNGSSLPQLVAPSIKGRNHRAAYLAVLPGSGELLHIRWKDSGKIMTLKMCKKAKKWVDISDVLLGHSLFFSDDFTPPQSMVCLPNKDLPRYVREDCMYIVDDGSLQLWDMDDEFKLKPYLWTAQNRREIEFCNLECGLVWIDPVISSLTVGDVASKHGVWDLGASLSQLKINV